MKLLIPLAIVLLALNVAYLNNELFKIKDLLGQTLYQLSKGKEVRIKVLKEEDDD